MRSKNVDLVIVLQQGKMRAWYIQAKGKSHKIPLQGEDEISLVDINALVSNLADIRERLNGDGLVIHYLHYLVDSTGDKLLQQASCQSQLQCNQEKRQILCLHWLANRFGYHLNDLHEQSLNTVIFPWLISADDAAEREQTSKALAAEQLKTELTKLQNPDMQQLLLYLPAIFKDFWNCIRPDELALIVGSQHIPDVASPYLPPSLATVQQKKRQFLSLAKEAQTKLLDLCTELAQSHNQLQVHNEFKSVIGALDQWAKISQ